MAETVDNDGQSERNANEPTLKPQRIKITRASDDGDKKVDISTQFDFLVLIFQFP